MILIEDALQLILGKIPVLGTERVAILEARDRVLAEDILAPRNIPPWDNSAMDGYAVRWKDVRQSSAGKPGGSQGHRGLACRAGLQRAGKDRGSGPDYDRGSRAGRV